MVRTWLAALATGLVLVAGEAPAAQFAKQDLSIPMHDGVALAATLHLPDGAAPAGGLPALVFLHGFGRDRSDSNALVEGSGLASGPYAILTFDARGHGASGGLVSVAGPREVADLRAVRDWLAARPDISDTKLGAWGVSYGGGTILNSLVAGVPWSAVVVLETWTDLYSALMPQGLVKSGPVAALSASVPDERKDPTLAALQAAAFAGNVAAVRPWAAARSSRGRLGSVRTPVLLAQGRRDFLFGIEQATEAFRRLRAPKALYVGLHGHAPSTFPAADTGFLMSQTRAWFDCFLAANPCSRAPAAVAIAPENFTGEVPWTTSLPRTRPLTFPFSGVTTFARSGKAVRRSGRLREAIEIFGTPTVKVSVAARGGWSRLVAVLTARTPNGKEIVVSAGGVPTAPGSQTRTIDLVNQATFVPRGSRLELTLASSSTAQSPSNLLYVDLPMRPAARARVGTAILRLPVLRTRITR